VLFSSGDWDVGGGDCQTNDVRNVTQFQPIFPASCEPSPICIQLVFCWRLMATLTRDAFIRPFCYCCWRDDWYQAQDGHLPHQRRILELLPSAFLPRQGCSCIHQKHGLYKCGLFSCIWRIISEECACLSYYSAQGCGFPDIAARADRYRVVVAGKTYHIGGTSASSSVCHLQGKYFSCTWLTLSTLL